MAISSPPVIVADSVTALDARHRDAVLVSGSHGGLIAAAYAASAHVRAAIFNDAGNGFDAAGTAGLEALQALGLAAVVVSHLSARIGDGGDTLASGIVSGMNAFAFRCGVTVGMACRSAAERLRGAPVHAPCRALSFAAEGRITIRATAVTGRAIVAIDSIGLVRAGDADRILVVGSHGGLHGGDPATALPVDAFAAFFHDAGRGKDDAGTSRLPVLEGRGIAAAAVDYRSARIGDARSLWDTGVVSCANAPMLRFGIVPGMTVQACVARLDAPDQST